MRTGAGQFVHIPRGTLHGFTNVGTANARFLAIVTPGGLHEKLLGEIGEPAKEATLPPPREGPPDVERMVATARRYDTEIPPPPEE